MTVYVDDMHAAPMGRFRRMKMSHMIADSESELHAMAARIGVARKWYQGDHYDIALSKRALAVQFGAVEISMRQLACMCALRRFAGGAGNLIDPATAVEVFQQRHEARKATLCKNRVAACRVDGGCLICDADSGETCREARP